MMASVQPNYGENNCLHICGMQGSQKCFDILLFVLKKTFNESPEILKSIINKRNRQGNTFLHEAYINK